MPKKATSKWIFFNNNFRHKREPNLFGDMGLNSGCYFRIIIILYFPPSHLAHCYKIHFLQHYHKIVKKRTERACFLSSDHVKTCDGYWKTKIEIANTKRHMAGTLTLSGFDSRFDFFPANHVRKLMMEIFVTRTDSRGCWLGSGWVSKDFS